MISSIFKGIIGNDLEQISKILDAQTLRFKEGDIIAAEEIYDRLFVIDEGSSRIIAIDEDGTRSVIRYFSKGDLIFQNMLYSSRYITTFLEITVSSEVTSLDFNAIKSGYDSSVMLTLMENITELSIDTSINNTRHTSILINRSIRKKLREYFEQQKNIHRSVKFKIPVSMAELADYLCVDRSAMLREIKKMQEDRLIISKNRHITLLV